MRLLRRMVLALLLALAIPACADKSIHQPALTDPSLLDHVPRVSNSGLAPCWQQREIAAQNGFFAGAKAGRPVVYKAPCDAATPVAAAPAAPKAVPEKSAPAPPAPVGPPKAQPSVDREKAGRVG